MWACNAGGRLAKSGLMVVEADGRVIVRSLAEPACFEVVFERHFASVHRYLRRRLGEDLAQELAAETFAQAFRARRRFASGHVSALPWLYGIAANLVRMNHRSEQRRLRAYARAGAREVVQPPGEEIDARLDALALRPVLGEALARLSTSQREVLLLTAWAGLSPEEISSALSLSPGAVRTRLHRARRQVAAALAAATPEAPEDPSLERSRS